MGLFNGQNKSQPPSEGYYWGDEDPDSLPINDSPNEALPIQDNVGLPPESSSPDEPSEQSDEELPIT